MKQGGNLSAEKQEEISKLEKKHTETWQEREKDITKKIEEVAKAGKEKGESSLAGAQLAEIESFEQDTDWKKHLQKVVDKLKTKSDKQSEDNSIKQKGDEKILKQYA